MGMNEDQAIRLCPKYRDPIGLEFLVRKCRREANLHAFALMGNADDASDACQGSFGRAFAAIARLAALDRFYPGSYRILRNCCLNMLEGRRTVFEHLIRCSRWREEFERLRETSGQLQALRFGAPTDELLHRLWRSPFSRLSRIAGLLLVILGYAFPIGFALFQFFAGGKEGLWVKLPMAAIVIGFIVLFVLVVLDRAKTYGKDPYREIER
jgi:hypothetical protein